MDKKLLSNPSMCLLPLLLTTPGYWRIDGVSSRTLAQIFSCSHFGNPQVCIRTPGFKSYL